MMRGNYATPNSATDHILIRAEKEQWEGTKPGDILTLKWNQFTSLATAGVQPLMAMSVMNQSFANGQHVIAGKVQMVVEIISALATPEVGDEITTETARANVQYRFIDNDNRLILYLNNVNGNLSTSGTIAQNNITIGTYTALII